MSDLESGIRFQNIEAAIHELRASQAAAEQAAIEAARQKRHEAEKTAALAGGAGAGFALGWGLARMIGRAAIKLFVGV